MSSYPWVVSHAQQGQGLDDLRHLARWLAAIKAWPATERAYARAAEVNTAPTVSAASVALLFGQTAATIAKT
jgi:GST-like protein